MPESVLILCCALAVALAWVDGASYLYSDGDLVPTLPVFAQQSSRYRSQIRPPQQSWPVWCLSCAVLCPSLHTLLLKGACNPPRVLYSPGSCGRSLHPQLLVVKVI